LYMLENLKTTNAEEKAQQMVLKLKGEASSTKDFIERVRDMIHKADEEGSGSVMPPGEAEMEQWD